MTLIERSQPARPPHAAPVVTHPPAWRARWAWITVGHLAVLALLVLLVYFGMWRAYFATLDDFGITGWVRSRASLWVAIQGYGSGVRFLNYAPIWWKTQAFGLAAAPYLWSSLAQYLVVVWLVYGLARQLLATRNGALLSAALFAVVYVHYEVVTYVSASDYTLWAIFYLTTVALFLRFLAHGGRWVYGGALFAYSCLALAHDFTLSMPLVLLALHLTLYWEFYWAGTRWRAAAGRQRIAMVWAFLRPHLLFWLVWALHVTLQLTLVLLGTSEAVYSVNGYAPGWHMLSNLRYLIFLLIPNVTTGPIHGFLTDHLAAAVVDQIWQGSLLLGLFLQVALLWALWRGPAAVRAAVALIYLPFLQYTPWQGHFIEAPRYLLLPSVGWALLLAWLFLAVRRTAIRRPWGQRLAVVGVGLFLLANTAVVQIWIRQHIENGEFRRTFVTGLAQEYLTVLGPDALVWIEVPEEKYTDLADSCRLVFDQYFVRCHTYVAGHGAPPTPDAVPADQRFYSLVATPNGITQRYPPD
jgi:hypothetical protein